MRSATALISATLTLCGASGCGLDWATAPHAAGDQPARRNDAPSEVMPIDRRPAVIHQAYIRMDRTGDRDPRDGVPDAMNGVLDALDRAHEAGFGRMVMNRPLPDEPDPRGRPDVEPQPLFASFNDLQPAMKRAWLTHIRRWADTHRDFSIEVYIALQDPAQGDKWDPSSYIEQLRPWLESGVRVVWLDAMTGERGIRLIERINRLPQLVDRDMGRRLIAGAEPVAVDFQKGEPIDVDRVPYVGANQFPGWPVIGAPSHKFDHDTTWINYWLARELGHAGSAESLYFERLRTNGYLPWVFFMPQRRQIHRVRRIFGFGTIESPADWNDDGTIDRADRALFLQRWNSGDETTFFNGDYDRDGEITERDRIAFENGWRSAVGGVPPAPIDLGRLPPPTAWARQRAEIISQRQAGSE